MLSYSACGLELIYGACVVLYAAIAAIAVHVSSRFGILHSFPVSCAVRWITVCEVDCMPTMLQIRPVHVDNVGSEARDFCGAWLSAVHRSSEVI
jgi:hypothetical protein